MHQFVKLRRGLFDHKMPKAAKWVFIAGLFYQRDDATTSFSISEACSFLQLGKDSVIKGLNWLQNNPCKTKPFFKITGRAYRGVPIYTIRNAEWNGNRVASGLKNRLVDKTDYSEKTTDLSEKPTPLYKEIQREEESCPPGNGEHTKDRFDDVLSAWNQTAKKHGWRSSAGKEADRDKVNAALRRKEFSAEWRPNMRKLYANGLGFVGKSKRHKKWKPSLKWFVSKETQKNIYEGLYWDGGKPDPHKTQKDEADDWLKGEVVDCG